MVVLSHLNEISPSSLRSLLDVSLSDSSIKMVIYLSITPVPGDPLPSSGFLGYYMHMVHRHICSQNTFIHKIKKSFLKTRINETIKTVVIIKNSSI